MAQRQAEACAERIDTNHDLALQQMPMTDQPLATEARDKRLWFTVALVNIILPSVSMLGLVLFR